MKSQVVKFTAPKAYGEGVQKEFAINEFPESLAEATAHWGEAVCFDNLRAMAVQKAGNKARATANPDKQGVVTPIEKIQEAMAGWKLGAITRAERAAFDPEKYVEALDDPEKITALLAKLRARQKELAR